MPLTSGTLQNVERSCFLKTESIQVQNLAGTPEFMAPEVVNFEDISTGSGSSWKLCLFFICIFMFAFQTCGRLEFSRTSSSLATRPSLPVERKTPPTKRSPTSPCKIIFKPQKMSPCVDHLVQYSKILNKKKDRLFPSRAKYDFDVEEFDSITAEAKVILCYVQNKFSKNW